MNTALWIVAGVLAFVFAGSGIMKLVLTKEKLVAQGLIILLAAIFYGIRGRSS